MKLIVGLGNIGEQYKFTRHNIGFEAIDELANIYGMSFNKFHDAYLAKGKISDKEVILCKPSLFMNSSGIPIKKVSNFYKILLEDIFIIFDDYSLPFGKIRFRRKGSSGGHNGIKSIINEFHSNENFCRLKLGINNETKINLSDFVLGKFREDEILKLSSLFEVVNKIVSAWVKDSNNKELEILNNYQIV